MMKSILSFASLVMLLNIPAGFAQTTVFFQGFENASTTCTENWGYTGGNRNTETAKTGSNSCRVGRSAESNTLTMNVVNISGLTGVTLTFSHSVRSGSGPGMDTREGAGIYVKLNGAASWTFLTGVSGNGDHSYGWTSTGGIANTCPNTYTTPNAYSYSVPAGTTTIQIKVISIGRNSSSCGAGTFVTDMTNGTATNFDRTDEGFFIDDIRLTTTATAIPGIWTGAVSTDWFNCSNWHNNIVPTSTTDVTIDQTASNNCVVGVAATGTAVCRNLSVSSNNGTNRTLTVQNNTSLTCSGNVSVTKSAGSGNQKLTLLDNCTFSCVNLTLTGSGSGAENAQFENEINTTVTATVNGNVVLNNGAKFDLTNSPNYGIIHIKGNYTNNGLETDFKQTNSIVHFDGTGAQSINTTSFNEVFSNIVVNKSSGTLTLNHSTDVENSVTFTNGVVNTSSSNLLIFYDGATAGSMSDASHVDGPVRKIGNETFTFPVGDAGNYQEITISAPGSSSDHFTAQYFQADPDPLYDDLLKDASLDHISSCEYWILDRTNGSSNVDVTLRWDASSCGVTVPADLRVARWNGSMWKDHGNGGTTGTTATGTIVTAGAVTAFSPFTLASVSTENPLPVELLNFTAYKDNHQVQTLWSTASEQNTQFHIVERSADGEYFVEKGRLPAAGFSNHPLYYQLRDEAPLKGTGYYRLKTIDVDGQVSYSPVVAVNNGEGTNVTVSYNEQGAVVNSLNDQEIELYNAGGQLIRTMNIKAGQSLSLSHLPYGLYLLNCKTCLDNQQAPLKVIIK